MHAFPSIWMRTVPRRSVAGCQAIFSTRTKPERQQCRWHCVGRSGQSPPAEFTGSPSKLRCGDKGGAQLCECRRLSGRASRMADIGDGTSSWQQAFRGSARATTRTASYKKARTPTQPMGCDVVSATATKKQAAAHAGDAAQTANLKVRKRRKRTQRNARKIYANPHKIKPWPTRNKKYAFRSKICISQQ